MEPYPGDWRNAVQYQYDAPGRVTVIDNGTAWLGYSYDAAGQLTAETSYGFPVYAARTLTHAHDNDGNRVSVQYPGGMQVAYTHTARGQVSSISVDGPPPLVTYTYDAAGRRVGKMLENGVGTTYGYDVAGRLTNLVHAIAAGNGVAGLEHRVAYTLNNVGNRTARGEALNGPPETETYGQDPMPWRYCPVSGLASPSQKMFRMP
jgi:YD repeat-containing protein